LLKIYGFRQKTPRRIPCGDGELRDSLIQIIGEIDALEIEGGFVYQFIAQQSGIPVGRFVYGTGDNEINLSV